MSALDALVKMQALKQKSERQGWEDLNKAILSIGAAVQQNRIRQLQQEIGDIYSRGGEVTPQMVGMLSAKYKIPASGILSAIQPMNKTMQAQKIKRAGQMMLDLMSKEKRLPEPEELQQIGQATGANMGEVIAHAKTLSDYLSNTKKWEVLDPETRNALNRIYRVPLGTGATYGEAVLSKELGGIRKQATPRSPGYRLWRNQLTGEYKQSQRWPGKGWEPSGKGTMTKDLISLNQEKRKQVKEHFTRYTNLIKQLGISTKTTNTLQDMLNQAKTPEEVNAIQAKGAQAMKNNLQRVYEILKSPEAGPLTKSTAEAALTEYAKYLGGKLVKQTMAYPDGTKKDTGARAIYLSDGTIIPLEAPTAPKPREKPSLGLNRHNMQGRAIGSW